MNVIRSALPFAACLLLTPALAQEIMTLGDLQAKSASPLSAAELQSLLPGAAMTMTNADGSTHTWANEADGQMIVSSDNRANGGRHLTARGSWKILDDGRYCMTIEWRRGFPEEQCRHIFKTGDGYFGVKALEPATLEARKMDIKR